MLNQVELFLWVWKHPKYKKIYLKSVLDVVLIFRDYIQLHIIEVACQVSPVEIILPVAVVFNAERGIGSIIDFISEEKIVLDQNIVSDSIGGHESKSKFIMLDNGSVVPS